MVQRTWCVCRLLYGQTSVVRLFVHRVPGTRVVFMYCTVRDVGGVRGDLETRVFVELRPITQTYGGVS